MKTLIVVLVMLGATSSAYAHSPHHLGQYRQPAAESFVGFTGQVPMTTPRPDQIDCNGGPCTLTGGPSGGPNQT